MEWYLKVLRHYTDFAGRARRKEYWMFALFNVIAALAASLIDGLLGMRGAGGIGPVYGLYGLAVLLPSIAVGVRRMHDIGKSGWMLLVALIPILGGLLVLYWFVQEGDPSDNAYGPDPKREPDYELA